MEYRTSIGDAALEKLKTKIGESGVRQGEVMQLSQPAIQSGRNTKTVLQSVLQLRHYRAFLNIILHHHNPIEFLGRYLFKLGHYPCVQKLKCNNVDLNLTVYSWHDILTLNEIFFRKDYPVTRGDKIIIDFGSNIGISAAYFLSASEGSFCYLFEPLPMNVSRLKENLRRFEGRYKLECAAVDLADGESNFGYEATGRYGGIGLDTGSYITVPCLDAVRVVKETIDKHGAIDVLKMDIESREQQIINAIPRASWSKIKKVFVEYTFVSNPLSESHKYAQHGSVAQFLPKDS
jgi:FkbM family methyltransferase